MPQFIIGNPVTDTADIKGVQIDIQNNVKTYPKMYYTTDFTAFSFIFRKLTLRSSSLTYAKLNDTTEKQRVGISQFAGSRFITCFSHINHESVPFWRDYGGNNNSRKMLLKFNNFSSYFCNAIHTDYCLLDGDKKLFFESEIFHSTVNQNGILGERMRLPKVNLDFDLRNCIRSIEMFDVEYLPVKHDSFIEDYSGEATIDFSTAKDVSTNLPILSGVKTFNPNCLGKQKSEPWDYEGESRILSCLNIQEFNEWNFIDLRLKEEIFRDLTIVLSPWLSDDLETDVQKIIEDSPISSEIKKTIKIEHSALEGTINV